MKYKRFGCRKKKKTKDKIICTQYLPLGQISTGNVGSWTDSIKPSLVYSYVLSLLPNDPFFRNYSSSMHLVFSAVWPPLKVSPYFIIMQIIFLILWDQWIHSWVSLQDVSQLKTKPTMWLCAQRRLRSAWASAQSDQSSLSEWRKVGPLATHWTHSEGSDQTGRMHRLIWVFAGRTVILLVLTWGAHLIAQMNSVHCCSWTDFTALLP